mmetsp:Transcript_20787/g.31789  ORF Transcript_20787/g.31789 Transcript_20787/m.31789 type:complete len:701 (+) Transcript_20787:2-2104(+)
MISSWFSLSGLSTIRNTVTEAISSDQRENNLQVPEIDDLDADDDFDLKDFDKKTLTEETTDDEEKGMDKCPTFETYIEDILPNVDKTENFAEENEIIPDTNCDNNCPECASPPQPTVNTDDGNQDAIVGNVCGVFWDLENLNPNSYHNGHNDMSLADGVRKLKKNLVKYGEIQSFRAYADLSRINAKTRDQLHLLGIALIDVPGHRKEAADKAMIVDMLIFALDNKIPATLILLSGDGDFSVALSRLRDRGYQIVLIHPSEHQVSNMLLSVADEHIAWDLIQNKEQISSKIKSIADELTDEELEEIVKKLTGTKVHNDIIKCLQAAGPSGMNAGQLFKKVKSFIPAVIQRSRGIDFNPANVLKRLPRVHSRKVNKHFIYYIDEFIDNDKDDFVETLYNWLLNVNDTLTIQVSKLQVFFDTIHDENKKARWKSYKVRELISGYGDRQVTYIDSIESPSTAADGTIESCQDILCANIPPKIMKFISSRLLHRQLEIQSGISFEDFPEFMQSVLNNEKTLFCSSMQNCCDKILSAIDKFPEFFTIKASMIYTKNFHNQQQIFFNNLLHTLTVDFPPQGLSLQGIETRIKRIKALSKSRKFAKHMTPFGISGLIDILVKKQILFQPHPTSSKFFLYNHNDETKQHQVPYEVKDVQSPTEGTHDEINENQIPTEEIKSATTERMTNSGSVIQNLMDSFSLAFSNL